MSSAFFCRKRLGKLMPIDQMGEEILSKVGPEEMVKVTVSRPRNPGHHRLYWQLCSFCAHHSDYSAEQVSTIFKIRTGHCDVLETSQGIVAHPKSISFAKMDQAQFSEFWDAVVKVVASEILPGVKAEEVRSEIESLTGLAA